MKRNRRFTGSTAPVASSRVSALLAALVYVVCCAGGCEKQHSDVPTIHVFAAASLAGVVDELADAFQRQRECNFVRHYGSSGMLARQIDAEARCDVYISADPQWIDWLADRNRIDPASRRTVAGNRLVVIVPADGTDTDSAGSPDCDGSLLADLPEGRLAVGDPDHVPAGRYARQAFTHLGRWEQFSERIVPALDVSAALKLVELRAVAGGVVYESDARTSGSVAIFCRFPFDAHGPIEYVAATTNNAGPGGEAFLEYITGDAGAAIFAEAGFVTAPEKEVE